jgi:hypothetical protein
MLGPEGAPGAGRSHTGIRQHTSAYVSIRQHTSAYVSIRQHTCRRAWSWSKSYSACFSWDHHTSAYVSIYTGIRQHIYRHTSAYVSMPGRSHTLLASAGTSIRQHTSAYVSIYTGIRQHTSAYATHSWSKSYPPFASAGAAYVSIRQHTSAYATHSFFCVSWSSSSSGVSICTFVPVKQAN